MFDDNYPILVNYDGYSIDNTTGLLTLTLSSISNLNGGANWNDNENKSRLKLTLTDPIDTNLSSTHYIPIGVQPVNDPPVMRTVNSSNPDLEFPLNLEQDSDNNLVVVQAIDADGNATVESFELSIDDENFSDISIKYY